jgi:hypothetical protein
VLFFVSDGVADEYNPHTCSEQTVSNGRCQEPINDALCTAIKNCAILRSDQSCDAELRVARFVLCGVADTGHTGSDECAVPERCNDGAPHQVKPLAIATVRPLPPGEDALFCRRVAMRHAGVAQW